MLKRMCISVVATLALLPAVARGQDAKDPAALRQAPPGSIAAQLSLKFRLLRVSNGSLAASLNQNQREWDNLSPEQRDKYRKEAYAFLRKSQTEQDKLIEHYSTFIALPAEKQEEYRKRAEWLKVVVNSFSAEERKALEQKPPAERAATLLQRRDDLVKQGKLKLDEPTTQPARTTQPGG
jgi:hypothetical protein